MVRKPHFTAIIKEVNKRTERVNKEVGEYVNTVNMCTPFIPLINIVFQLNV